MSYQGFRDTGGDLYVSQELTGTSSSAIGLDAGDSGKLKIVASTSNGVTPTGTVQLEIDPAANGNITLDPNGSGATVLASGDLNMQAAGNIELAYSNAAATQGYIKAGGVSLVSSIHSSNIFVGAGAGNSTLNVFLALNNAIFGAVSFQAVTDGANNSGVGSGVLSGITTGNANIAMGLNAGQNYTTESNNIVLGNLGTAADSGVIRIGNAVNHTSAYIAGAYGVTPGGTINVGYVDSNGQLGSVAVLPIAYGGTNANTMATTYGVNYYDGTRLVTTAVGNAGEILTSNGVGVAPTFQAAPATGISQLDGDSGSATGATITLAGTANQIVTSAAGATVTFALTPSVTIANDLTLTNGDANIGNTDAATTAPFVFLKKSRTGGVITTGDVIGQVSFQGYDGAAYVTGASITSTSSGTIAANRVASNLVFATHPDSASGLNPTTRMTIASTGSVTIAAPDSGTGLTVSGGETLSTGNLAVTAGNITLPNATTTQGIITCNSINFLYRMGGSGNVFVGGAGTPATIGANDQYNIGIGSSALANLQNNAAPAQYNIGIGNSALALVYAGQGNVAIGTEALANQGSQSFCTAVGYQALKNLGDREYNIAIGYQAGISLTGAANTSNILIGNSGTAGQSNAIKIGTQGSGAAQQDKCYIAGIASVAVSNTNVVTIDTTTGQMGSVSSVTVPNGGTGNTTFTAYSVICAGTTATGAFQNVSGVGTAGQVLTSSGAGALPVWSTPTGVAWTDVTGTSQAAAVNNGYIANNAGLVTITLPSSAAVGSIVRVSGLGAGGWRVAQNAGQLIHLGNTVTTTGAGGRLDSTNQYDAVELLCVVTNTTWNVLSSVGNITVT